MHPTYGKLLFPYKDFFFVSSLTVARHSGWAYATGVDWVTGVSVGDSLLADEHEDHEH